MIICAVCCVTGMLNHNLPLVFHPDTVFSAPSSSFITTNPWLVCLLQPHSLYPMHRPRVLPSPHFHLNCYTECFFLGGGISLTQVGVIWEEGASIKESSPIRLTRGQVYVSFSWLMIDIGGWHHPWADGPGMAAWEIWQNAGRRTSKLAVSAWFLPLLLLAFLPWFPSVMVCDGVMSAK